ncbi:MAG: hypothetical protein ACTSQE_12215 [Candidatus Heimdallarchaeaceae archaeon]
MRDLKAEEIETPYLNDEVQIKRATPFSVFWAMTKITAWQNFTHHPTCSVYKNHYFSIGPLKLCVGCTSVYSSLTLKLILYFTLQEFFNSNLLIFPIICLIGVTAAIGQYLIKPENKWIKAFLRSLLGFGLGAYILLIVLTPKWWLRIVLFVIALGGVYLYNLMRGKANIEYCDTCPLHFAEPRCDPFENTQRKIQKLNQLIDEQIAKIKETKNKATTSIEEEKEEKAEEN